MNRKYFLKTLLVLSLSAIFVFTLSGTGICIDKAKIDLSEYRAIGNSTFVAYKYAFGGRTTGTLRYVVTPTDDGFNLEWNEEYPLPDGDGTALYLAFDYQVTNEGLLEKNTYRYGVKYDVPGYPSRGDLELRSAYRDPFGTPGNLDPLLTFPYAVVEVGYMWGDAFIEKVGQQPIYYPRVYQFAVLGLEDVTVPAGTYPACVKIARFRGNQADRIAWYAKGVGVVKMILAQEEHSHRIQDETSGLNVELRVYGYNRAFVLQSVDY